MKSNKQETGVAVIGAGGIGSHLCRSLIPALSRGDLVRELGGVEVVVFDSDIVSDSNLAHQGFSPSSIGMAKVLALESSLSEFESQFDVLNPKGLIDRITSKIELEEKPYQKVKEYGVLSPHMPGLFDILLKSYYISQNQLLTRTPPMCPVGG